MLNWRNKVETDINEVLQIATVFENVSKGVAAKTKDLKDVFGTDDHMVCALEVLNKGELEVSERERQLMLESLFRDVATIVAEKCVNPETQRPYTVSLIERALHDSHFSVNAAKSAKQQALKAISVLRKHIAIERAKMRVRLTVPSSALAEGSSLQRRLRKAEEEQALIREGESTLKEGEGEAAKESSLTVLDLCIDPGYYRSLEDEVDTLTRSSSAAAAAGGGGGGVSRASLEVLSLSVQAEAALTGGGGAGKAGRGGGAGGRGGDSDEDEDDEDDDEEEGAYRSSRSGGLADNMSRMTVAGAGAGASAAGAGSAAPSSAATVSAAAAAEAEIASARGTGMMVRRVVQPGRSTACKSCSMELGSAEEYREHCRSPMHTFNQKRKAKGMATVTLEQFEAISQKDREAFLNSYE